MMLYTSTAVASLETYAPLHPVTASWLCTLMIGCFLAILVVLMIIYFFSLAKGFNLKQEISLRINPSFSHGLCSLIVCLTYSSGTSTTSSAFDNIFELVTVGITTLYFWRDDYSVSKWPRTPSFVYCWNCQVLPNHLKNNFLKTGKYTLMCLFSQSDLLRHVAYSSRDIMIRFLLLLLKHTLKRGICHSDCVVSAYSSY